MNGAKRASADTPSAKPARKATRGMGGPGKTAAMPSPAVPAPSASMSAARKRSVRKENQ